LSEDLLDTEVVKIGLLIYSSSSVSLGLLPPIGIH